MKKGKKNTESVYALYSVIKEIRRYPLQHFMHTPSFSFDTSTRGDQVIHIALLSNSCNFLI